MPCFPGCAADPFVCGDPRALNKFLNPPYFRALCKSIAAILFYPETLIVDVDVSCVDVYLDGACAVALSTVI